MSNTSERKSALTRTAVETQQVVERSLKRRYRAEMRFRAYGLLAVAVGILFVGFLFATITAQGLSVFRQAYVQLPVYFDPQVLDPAGTRIEDDLLTADYQALVRESLKQRFAQVEGRANLRELYRIASSAATIRLREMVLANPGVIGQRLDVPLLMETRSMR